MSEPQHNYSSAFVDFCKGSPIEEVAEANGIPVDTLKVHAHRMGWRGLMTSMLDLRQNAMVPVKTSWAAVKLESNRQSNYEQATKLREMAEGYIRDAMDRGVQLPPKTLRDLACAVATIHDLTYRALGDVPAKKDANQSDRPANTAIHVHLPAVLASPRPTKAVIDVETVSDQPEEAFCNTVDVTGSNDEKPQNKS